MTNIHACLVHEKSECVSDLVANLRFLDPESLILLYDGSKGRGLLEAWVGADVDGMIIHPDPRPMRWGRLHDFAFDALRLAMTVPEFTTLTVVDSDQLASRPGYSTYLGCRLSDDLGCLVSADGGYQHRLTKSAVARAAWEERTLWQPLLNQLSGDDCFPQWTFWPATVITRAAAADILRLAELPTVEEILRRTRLWASEEVVLPTLVALAGHRVEVNPCSSDYVRYRARYTRRDVQRALQRSDVFWLHPVARRYHDPTRRFVREYHAGYASDWAASKQGKRMADPLRSSSTATGQLVTLPVLDRMESIPGVLTRAEGDLLLAAARRALAVLPPPHEIYLMGGSCGRARFILAAATKEGDPDTTVSIVGPEMRTRSRDDATASLVVTGGRVDGFAAALEEFSAAAERLVAGGLLAWRSPRSAGPGEELTEALVRLGVLTRLSEAESMSILQQVRRLTLPPLRATLDRSERTEGWLSRDEAALLALTVGNTGSLPPGVIVEIGSYCGRATVILAAVAKLVERRVLAVDRFDGVVGELGALHRCEPTLDKFRYAITEARLEDVVEVVESSTESLDWAGRPVAVLLVDGLHDYASAARDFFTFADDIVEGGLVAFHDCADYYPGVQALVRELKATAGWRLIAVVGTLVLFQRVARQGTPLSLRSTPTAVSAATMTSSPPQDTVHGGDVGPLVSCIMPTKNRPAFVKLAISYFLRQDYPFKELIIVDDGDESVEHLIPADDRIRYLRTSARGTIGGKRNVACEHATGNLIAHWDDDDWYAPTRLSRQVEALLTGDCDVVGANQLLYWAPEAAQVWRYAYPAAGRPWLHDPTLCYPRALWSAQPFSQANHALDCRWLRSGRRKRLRSLDTDPPLYVGIIHAANTSTKATSGAWWTPASLESLTEVVGADLDHYLTGVL